MVTNKIFVYSSESMKGQHYLKRSAIQNRERVQDTLSVQRPRPHKIKTYKPRRERENSKKTKKGIGQ